MLSDAGSNDIICPVELYRWGSQTTFNVGDDDVNTKAEYESAFEVPRVVLRQQSLETSESARHYAQLAGRE
jgi:hypothetical protein